MPERPIDETEGAVAGRSVDLVRKAVAAAILEEVEYVVTDI